MADITAVAADIKRRLAHDPSAHLKFLAQLFEDSSISDNGSGNELQKRLVTILDASADSSYPV